MANWPKGVAAVAESARLGSMVTRAASALTEAELLELIMLSDTACGDTASTDYKGSTYNGLQWHVRVLHDTAPQAQSK